MCLTSVCSLSFRYCTVHTVDRGVRLTVHGSISTHQILVSRQKSRPHPSQLHTHIFTLHSRSILHPPSVKNKQWKAKQAARARETLPGFLVTLISCRLRLLASQPIPAFFLLLHLLFCSHLSSLRCTLCKLSFLSSFLPCKVGFSSTSHKSIFALLHVSHLPSGTQTAQSSKARRSEAASKRTTSAIRANITASFVDAARIESCACFSTTSNRRPHTPTRDRRSLCRPKAKAASKQRHLSPHERRPSAHPGREDKAERHALTALPPFPFPCLLGTSPSPRATRTRGCAGCFLVRRVQQDRTVREKKKRALLYLARLPQIRKLFFSLSLPPFSPSIFFLPAATVFPCACFGILAEECYGCFCWRLKVSLDFPRPLPRPLPCSCPTVVSGRNVVVTANARPRLRCEIQCYPPGGDDEIPNRSIIATRLPSRKQYR
jgi:hypothetical protein